MPTSEESPPVSATATATAAAAARPVAVLVARSSITGASDREMQTHCERLAVRGKFAAVHFAYTEQGVPSLRDTLELIADAPAACGAAHDVLLLPLLLPMEPSFTLYLRRVVKRWQERRARQTADGSAAAWPVIRLAPAPSETDAIAVLIDQQALAAQTAPPLDVARLPAAEGATVPAQQWRVLVCQGAPCNEVGAAVVWGHLRNMQKTMNLRTEGPGVMTCKTTCLGPCGLAPVLQVFPGGSVYGGVDEAGVERIVHEHLLGGAVVQALIYEPGRGKQWLRSAEAADVALPVVALRLDPSV